MWPAPKRNPNFAILRNINNAGDLTSNRSSLLLGSRLLYHVRESKTLLHSDQRLVDKNQTGSFACLLVAALDSMMRIAFPICKSTCRSCKDLPEQVFGTATAKHETLLEADASRSVRRWQVRCRWCWP